MKIQDSLVRLYRLEDGSFEKLIGGLCVAHCVYILEYRVVIGVGMFFGYLEIPTILNPNNRNIILVDLFF